jgi:hypothetical protein
MQKPKPIKGRGTASNAASRFVEFTREAFDDGWEQEEDEALQPEDMNIPGFGFHGLEGKPKRYGVSVTGNWRITFGWEGEDAIHLNLEDYH